jgi:hypothetical protein
MTSQNASIVCKMQVKLPGMFHDACRILRLVGEDLLGQTAVKAPKLLQYRNQGTRVVQKQLPRATHLTQTV